MANVKPIPDGYNTLTPHITVTDARKAIDFYKRAFGAKDDVVMPGPDGKSIMHAELKFGNSVLMLGEEMKEMGALSPTSLGGTPTSLFMYVEDVDKAFKTAVDAGAKSDMPPTDMFWGDRYGKLTDPFGHKWGIATHKEDLTPEQMKKGQDAFFAQMANNK